MFYGLLLREARKIMTSMQPTRRSITRKTWMMQDFPLAPVRPYLFPRYAIHRYHAELVGSDFGPLATAAAVLQAGLSVESACWCQSLSPNRDCWDMNFTTRQSGISTLCLIVSRHNRLRESSAPCPHFPSRLGAAREQFFPSRALLSIALCTQCTTILHRTIAL